MATGGMFNYNINLKAEGLGPTGFREVPTLAKLRWDQSTFSVRWSLISVAFLVNGSHFVFAKHAFG